MFYIVNNPTQQLSTHELSVCIMYSHTPRTRFSRSCFDELKLTYLFVSQIKGSFSSRSGQGNFNPYSEGSMLQNCAAVLCGPLHPRYIHKKKCKKLIVVMKRSFVDSD